MSRYISGDREPKTETIASIVTALYTISDYLLGIENDEFDYPRVSRILDQCIIQNVLFFLMVKKLSLVLIGSVQLRIQKDMNIR